MIDRPQVTVVFAVSADGKISDVDRQPARLGSRADLAHLERQVALGDAVLMGAGTLRAEGSVIQIKAPDLLADRSRRGQPPQVRQVIVSASGRIDPVAPLFNQAVPCWLATTVTGAETWRDRVRLAGQKGDGGFERVEILGDAPQGGLDLAGLLRLLRQLGIQRLVALGGGGLVGELLLLDAIDELWLTVCPWLVGGALAPTAVDGPGLPLAHKLPLVLQTIDRLGDEVFLHYVRPR